MPSRSHADEGSAPAAAHAALAPVILIPARMAAARLPGKPLADIHGTPMIVHVLRRAEAAAIGPVHVAAADREIVDAAAAAGGSAVLTDPLLPSGSDRVFAALEAVDPDGRHRAVVNLQGDLPDIAPAHIRAVVGLLASSGADIATLAAPIREPAEREDPNVVKAVFSPAAPDLAWDAPGQHGPAHYFSRNLVPAGEGPAFHHLGIYAYRREALARFVRLPPSALERRERLEQLRALAAGMTIALGVVDSIPVSVDTPADLIRARRIIAP